MASRREPGRSQTSVEASAVAAVWGHTGRTRRWEAVSDHGHRHRSRARIRVLFGRGEVTIPLAGKARVSPVVESRSSTR